jgi:hypothetical protein
LRVSLATDPSSPDWPNEDFAAVTPGTAVLIDGAGSPGGRDTGCLHGVAWYARTLGGHIIAAASGTACPLPQVLATAIEQVRDDHSGTCDLDDPATPSGTVIIARQHGSQLDYLVLADSLLLLMPVAGELQVITDNRLEDLAAGLRPDYRNLPVSSAERETARRDYLLELDARRNTDGGYWSAAADPAAADQAITGSIPVSDLAALALLSDGVGRLADRYHQATWPEIAETLAKHGPCELVRQVREAEAADPEGTRWPRGKLRDDATALYWSLA